jgi:hypothetical protein
MLAFVLGYYEVSGVWQYTLVEYTLVDLPALIRSDVFQSCSMCPLDEVSVASDRWGFVRYYSHIEGLMLRSLKESLKLSSNLNVLERIAYNLRFLLC